MLFYPGGNSQDIWVEDNVVRVYSGLLHQQVVGPSADLYFPFKRVGMPFFVEGHHDDSRTQLFYHAGVFEKNSFSLFQGDGIDNGFSLNTF